MDAFEQVVSEILWRKGYWVRTSVKVELTKEEKRAIGRPSAPRWELDVVAYRAKDNLLRVIECKSYIDSAGVGLKGLTGESDRSAGRYKLFNDSSLRRVVFRRLEQQFVGNGACRPEPSIRLGLACGKTRKGVRPALKQHFEAMGWDLLDEEWLRESLRDLANSGYENQVSAVVAKLLLRGAVE